MKHCDTYMGCTVEGCDNNVATKRVKKNRVKLYYTPPPDEAFNELRAAAMIIWQGYEEPYRSDKIARIATIGNIEDNFMYMVAMFDINNQHRLAALLTPETKKEVSDRLDAGGTPDYFNYFKEI